MARPCHLPETPATPVTRSMPHSTLPAESASMHERRPASAQWKVEGKKQTNQEFTNVFFSSEIQRLAQKTVARDLNPIPIVFRHFGCFVLVSGEQQHYWQLARAWCRHGVTSWTTPCHWCAPIMMSTLMCFPFWMYAHWNTWPTFSRLLFIGLRPWTSRPL